VENIGWSMLKNLNISFAGFARKTQERLYKTVGTTKGAMEAAHSRRQADGGKIETEVKRMSDRIAALKAAKADIAMLQSSLSPADESNAGD